MGLSEKEKIALKKTLKPNQVWTDEEKEKLEEARREPYNATPKIIYDLKIFPNKTYKQIRDKFYNM
jgi:hypothetical protein